MTLATTLFVWGGLAMAAAVIGLLFLKFWRRTQDRLFLFFAAAFWGLATNWIVLALTPTEAEARHEAYFVRLAAFGLIIAGILDKNRRRSA